MLNKSYIKFFNIRFITVLGKTSWFLLFYSVVHAQQAGVETILGKLKLLHTLITTQTNLKYAKSLINELVEELDPKEKRRAEFVHRMAVAQQEAAIYAAKKNAPKPFVSFYIPVYNRQDVVRDSIESIYNQRLSFPFEVVAVDDASTDGTYVVLQQYEEKYSNFFVYRHAINKKAPATRNTAILHCRGKWLFGLDSDDILVPGMVEELLKSVIEHHADVGLFGEYHYFNDFNPHTIVSVRRGRIAHGLLRLNECLKTHSIPFTCGCKIFTHQSVERVGGYIEEDGHDTWAFNYLQLARGLTAYVLPACGYLHRRWSNGNCYTQQQVAKNWSISPFVAVREYKELLTPNSILALKKLAKNGKSFLFKEIKSLSIIDRSPLSRLFQVYKLLDDENYVIACRKLIKLINHGVNHIRIHLYLLKSSFYSNNYKISLTSIRTIIKKLKKEDYV